MQATAPGRNRTGASVSATEVDLMLQAVDELSPPQPIDTSRMEVERQAYITEADSVGSIPPVQADGKGRSRKRDGQEQGMNVFLDKLGERLAFERTGTRLYDALITKHRALVDAGQDPLPPTESDLLEGDGTSDDDGEGQEQESPAETLQRIRADELEHFLLLSECVAALGGDPTAQTPCADVTAAASIGLLQVVSDPRTTLAQSLSAVLTAELTDSAGWEMLAQLAEDAGQKEMASSFLRALEVEQGHLETVRSWLQQLLTAKTPTPAV